MFDYKKIYGFQDRVLHLIGELRTGFYLSGGTAASRGYLNHRYSEDLDFFTNDSEEFTLWADRVINTLQGIQQSNLQVSVKEARFVRMFFKSEEFILKLEFINDVPSHIGDIRKDKVLGAIDSAENILANKVTAFIDRNEPKDLADIWGFCCKMRMNLKTAIEDAQSKAAGIFPPVLAEAILSVTQNDWEYINWIHAPEPDQFIKDLNVLGESLILIK